jgi:uncharacterized protein
MIFVMDAHVFVKENIKRLNSEGIKTGMKKIIVCLACAAIFIAWRSESDNTTTRIDREEPVICSSANGAVAAARNDLQYTNASTDKVVVEINTVSEGMAYDVTSFTVKAGQELTIKFTNRDSQQHNFILGKIGSLAKIGAAADALAMSTNGADKGYLPESELILKASPLLNEEEEFEITLTTPAQPGDYPYMCTFPGHWRIMNGVMKVVKG